VVSSMLLIVPVLLSLLQNLDLLEDDFSDSSIQQMALFHASAEGLGAVAALELASNMKALVTEWYVKPRSLHWWTEYVQGHWSDDTFTSFFRVKRSTFNALTTLLAPLIAKQDTNYKKSVPPAKRLAIALWFFAKGEDQRSLSERFGVGQSTVCKIIKQVAAAIVTVFRAIIHWPRTAAEAATCKNGFYTEHKFPDVVAVGDGVHFPIMMPKDAPCRSDYINRKGSPSVVGQGFCDSSCCFVDAVFCYPGSVHDSRILRNSSMFTRAEAGTLFPPGVNGILLVDSGYPLLPWLITPFSWLTSDHRCKRFNKIHSRARQCIERAWGMLKARFRCLLKRLDSNIENTCPIIMACIMLHNVCIRNKEDFLKEWEEELKALEPPVLPTPEEQESRHDDVDMADSESGAVIRNGYADLFMANPRVYAN
jgi:DDE superfamily endonuclease